MTTDAEVFARTKQRIDERNRQFAEARSEESLENAISLLSPTDDDEQETRFETDQVGIDHDKTWRRLTVLKVAIAASVMVAVSGAFIAREYAQTRTALLKNRKLIVQQNESVRWLNEIARLNWSISTEVNPDQAFKSLTRALELRPLEKNSLTPYATEVLYLVLNDQEKAQYMLDAWYDEVMSSNEPISKYNWTIAKAQHGTNIGDQDMMLAGAKAALDNREPEVNQTNQYGNYVLLNAFLLSSDFDSVLRLTQDFNTDSKAALASFGLQGVVKRYEAMNERGMSDEAIEFISNIARNQAILDSLSLGESHRLLSLARNANFFGGDRNQVVAFGNDAARIAPLLDFDVAELVYSAAYGKAMMAASIGKSEEAFSAAVSVMHMLPIVRKQNAITETDYVVSSIVANLIAGKSSVALDRTQDAQQFASQLLGIAQAAKNPRFQIVAAHSSAYLEVLTGRNKEAIAAANIASKIASTTQIPDVEFIQFELSGFRAIAFAREGKLDESRKAWAQASTFDVSDENRLGMKAAFDKATESDEVKLQLENSFFAFAPYPSSGEG